MSREWTAADQARFDATVERLRDRGTVDPGVFCAHCDLPIDQYTFMEPCPGCRRLVCGVCYRRRQQYAAQSCRKER